jgi:hypothetical protein
MLLFLTLVFAALEDVPTSPLAGQVVDAAGSPVAGADVLLTGLPEVNGVPVVAKGKTDADGRFALERPAKLAREGGWRAVRLWVSHPGDQMAIVAFPGPLPTADQPVRVALPPRGHTEFRVEGPDGRPVGGARVRAKSIAPYFVEPPAELAARVEATTDADGLATLDALSGERVSHVEVEADGLGIQPRDFNPPLGGPRRIRLRRAGSLEGRFVTEDGRPLPGWKVSATTQANDEAGPWSVRVGRTETVPLAEDGRFRFPAIAAGALDLWVDWPDGPDPDVLPAWPQTMIVEAGKVNRVEIPVRLAATIEGVIRERGTGAPIPGVRLYLFRPGESSGANTRTDAEGRFRFRSLPGKARVGINEVPTGFIQAPAAFRDEFRVPAPPGRVVLPPVELSRAAPPLRGVVRDASGASVTGAEVSGNWTFVESNAAISGNVATTADAEGRFAVAGIAPDAKVSLTARKGDRATGAPVEARGGQDAEVTLTVKPRKVVAIAGRVVDQDGTPLAGAAVSFNAQERRAGQNSTGWRQLNFESGQWIYTGPDGTFRTPGELRREGAEYRAQAIANGYTSLQSPWTPAGDADVVRLGDLVLRRENGLRVVSGRVVDAAGAPVAGARVLQRGDGPRPTEAVTDAAGRFRLPGVEGGQVLICAEATGFRLGGAIAGPDGPVGIRLTRVGEAVRPLGRAHEPMTRAAERALGLSLLEPALDELRSRQQVMGLLTADDLLARLAPDRGVAMLEERVVSRPSEALTQVALARFEDDAGAAVATLDADRSGAVRAHGLLALADLAAAIAPARRADLLDRALAEARRLDQAETKLLFMGEIADRWLESFDLDRAAPILREGQKILEAVRPEVFGYQVAPFGEALAAVDLPAAEAFLARRAPGGSDDIGTKMRDRGAMAVRLAVADPAAAERLARDLKEVPNFYETTAYLLRIARNMARADLPRARAMLELLDDPTMPVDPGRGPLKPYGLSLLAEARADTDPEGARGLLDEAFDGLRAVAEASLGRPTSPPVASVMASLLPLVERIQPGRLAECLWLAVACRPGRPESLQASWTGAEGQWVGEVLCLAALVSRYDRAMAAVIYEPAGARLPALAGQENGGGLLNGGVASPLKMLTAYDPRALAALIERLPAPARVTRDNGQGWVSPSLENLARLAGAEVLGLPPGARRDAELQTPFGTWPARGNGRFLRQWP